MSVRFSLGDLILGTTAICAMLGAFCLLPREFDEVSLALLPAATTWHLVKNDWCSCLLSGLVGASVMYLDLALVAISPTYSIGAFLAETLFWVGPYGFVVGFVVGAVARVVRTATVGPFSRQIEDKGYRRVLVWIFVGYSIPCLVVLGFAVARGLLTA